MNIKNIIEGWENFMNKDEGSTNLAAERAKHCIECPFAKKMPLMIFNDGIKEIKGMGCSKCGCPLSAKLRTKSESCDIGKF